MLKIGLDMPQNPAPLIPSKKHRAVATGTSRTRTGRSFPLIIRPAFTLGGSGRWDRVQ